MIDYIRYRVKWWLAQFFTPAGPIHLDLEVTSRCNLRCITCPHSETPRQFPIGDMEVEMAEHLLEQGAKLGIYSVKFNWRGEPLLYPHLHSLVAYAKRLGYVDTMINTNGNVPTSVIDMVIDAGIDTIIFSIDSVEPAYFDIRKGGELQVAITNVAHVAALKREIGKPARVIVQARKQALNKDEIDSGRFQRFWQDFKGVEVKIGPAMQRTTTDTYTCEGRIAQGRTNCHMPDRRILVDWQGNFYPCCCDWFGKAPYGNARALTLDKVWRSFDALRRALKNGEAFTAEPCRSCFAKESYRFEKQR